VRLLLQFFQSIILARMLDPLDFGVAASVVIVVGMATAIADPGVSSVVVQWRRSTPALQAAATWTALVAGSLAALTIVAIAPAVSEFFKADQLKSALYLSAVTIVFISLAALPSGLLMREQRFRAQAFIAITASTLSVAVGVAAAMAGYGVMSLFIIPLVGFFVTATMQFIAINYVFNLVSNRNSIREVLYSVKYLVGVRITDALQGGFANAAIARLVGLQDLGLFNRAEGLKQMPTALASAVIGRLYFPRFAAAARKENGVVDASFAMLSASRNVTLITIPVFLMFYVYSTPLVEFLYGPKWTEASVVLKILLPGSFFYLMHLLYVNFLLGMGGSGVYFRLDIIKKIILISSIGTLFLGSIADYSVALSLSWFFIFVMYFFQARRAGLIVNMSCTGSVVRYIIATITLFGILNLAIMSFKSPSLFYKLFFGLFVILIFTPITYLVLRLVSRQDLMRLPGLIFIEKFLIRLMNYFR
jgi:O-antigen/teichoic acid export membrane protein